MESALCLSHSGCPIPAVCFFNLVHSVWAPFLSFIRSIPSIPSTSSISSTPSILLICWFRPFLDFSHSSTSTAGFAEDGWAAVGLHGRICWGWLGSSRFARMVEFDKCTGMKFHAHMIILSVHTSYLVTIAASRGMMRALYRMLQYLYSQEWARLKGWTGWNQRMARKWQIEKRAESKKWTRSKKWTGSKRWTGWNQRMARKQEMANQWGERSWRGGRDWRNGRNWSDGQNEINIFFALGLI